VFKNFFSLYLTTQRPERVFFGIYSLNYSKAELYKNFLKESDNMKKLTKSETKKVTGGGLNWQCRRCGARGWGILSSFFHNMIPGHHSFKTW